MTTLLSKFKKDVELFGMSIFNEYYSIRGRGNTGYSFFDRKRSCFSLNNSPTQFYIHNASKTHLQRDTLIFYTDYKLIAYPFP